MTDVAQAKANRNVIFLVIVASLGYFVDIYDLLIFSIVRVKSLNDIGITDKAAITTQGTFIINVQMFGLLLGGILWGIIGDKLGRIKFYSDRSFYTRPPTSLTAMFTMLIPMPSFAFLPVSV